MPWIVATSRPSAKVKSTEMGFPLAALSLGGNAPIAEIGGDFTDVVDGRDVSETLQGEVSEIFILPSIGYNGSTQEVDRLAPDVGYDGVTQPGGNFTPGTTGYPAVSSPVVRIAVPGYSSVNGVSIPKSLGIGYAGGGSWTENTSIEFYEDGSIRYNPEAASGTIGYPSTNTFAFNPYTQELLLFVGYVRDEDPAAPPRLPMGYSGVPLQVQGKRSFDYVGTTDGISILPARETNLVTGRLPSIFSRFPMQGQFTVSLGFEQQPSGAFAFEVPGYYRSRVLCDLSPGKSLNIYGVWFRINSLDIEERPRREYPSGLLIVSVSLGGYNEEVLDWNVPFKGGVSMPGSVPGVNQTGDKEKKDEDDDIDPECVLNAEAIGAPNTNANTIGGDTNKISLSQIAGKAQFCYQGPNVFVPIPENATKYDCTNWKQHATEAVRLNNQFLDYTERCVRGIRWGGGRTFRLKEDDIYSDTVRHSVTARDEAQDSLGQDSYLLPEMDTVREFPFTPTPIQAPRLTTERQRCIPYGAKYCRVRLDGDYKKNIVNKQAEEKTKLKIKENHRPRWKLIPPIRTTTKSGDVFPFSPPIVDPRTEEGLPDISMIGQSQKTESVTITESGAVMEERNTVWGYWGTLHLRVRWGIIEHSVTTYRYDEKTGYLLGNKKEARRWLQLATESPGDRVRDTRWLYPPGGDTYAQQWWAILNFQWVSIGGEQKIGIVTHSYFYGNIEPPPTVEYKHCLRSGKSVMRQEPDPNYVEPAFAEVIVDSNYGLAWRTHPDSEPGAELPPFTTGQRSESRTTIQIDQAIYEKVNRIKPDGSPGSGVIHYKDDPSKGSYYKHNSVFGNEVKPDMYTQYVCTESAQGPNFRDFARDSKFTENIGRPATHTRKPKNFERVPDPEDEDVSEDDEKDGEDKKYNYYLTSPGCLRRDYCEQGSKNYTYARTRGQAKNAAQTELEIADFKNSVKTTCEVAFNPDMRPGDRIQMTFNGVTCHRIVDTVSWTLTMQGWGNGRPVITWEPMSLSLGIDRSGGIPVNMSREKDPNAENNKPDPTNEGDKEGNEDRLDPLRNDKFRITWNGQRSDG